MGERTPFPYTDTTTVDTGYEWLGAFMEAQASVMANSLFFAFKLGQIGVAGRTDKALGREMLADLQTDRADLAGADEQLLRVIDGLLANIERNLDRHPLDGEDVEYKQNDLTDLTRRWLATHRPTGAVAVGETKAEAKDKLLALLEQAGGC